MSTRPDQKAYKFRALGVKGYGFGVEGSGA